MDQQQHSCETLICQRHQTILRLLSSAATASTRWRVRELYCKTTYVPFHSHNSQAIFPWTEFRRLICTTERLSFFGELYNKVTYRVCYVGEYQEQEIKTNITYVQILHKTRDIHVHN